MALFLEWPLKSVLKTAIGTEYTDKNPEGELSLKIYNSSVVPSPLASNLFAFPMQSTNKKSINSWRP